MSAYDYDVLVVGAGQGGLPAAHMAANLGAKVTLIEEREVGGTCSAVQSTRRSRTACTSPTR